MGQKLPGNAGFLVALLVILSVVGSATWHGYQRLLG
jgi:uncharacterized membrane protein